jgi:hypothetical protein
MDEIYIKAAKMIALMARGNRRFVCNAPLLLSLDTFFGMRLTKTLFRQH